MVGKTSITNKRPLTAMMKVLSYLPGDTAERIRDFLTKTGTSEREIGEIRLRSNGPLSLVVRGENVSLGFSVGREEVERTFERVCDGAVFKHRDDVSRGFVSIDGGIRVGVGGHARYEGGAEIGVDSVSTLVFRIPSGRCSFARELYRDWLKLSGGMLIASRAGEGKTTAIRALAGLIGSGRRARRVVVVDERCEFIDEYTGAQVDILRGYRRDAGVEIAIRTLSAEVLIVDEISSARDSAALLGALGAGVNVIATVHAHSLEDALKRGYVRELIFGGLFRGLCRIQRTGADFSYTIFDIEEGLESRTAKGSDGQDEKCKMKAESQHGVGVICSI